MITTLTRHLIKLKQPFDMQCLVSTTKLLRVDTQPYPSKIVKGGNWLCCMWIKKLWVGLSITQIYSLMGSRHADHSLSPPVITLRRSNDHAYQGSGGRMSVQSR